MKNYDLEVKERFCETEVYSEYANKTANYTSENWQNVTEGLNAIFNKFAVCMQNGYTAQSANAQELVKELQLFITEKFYTCTDKILSGLSQIYVADERFKENIDKQGSGTAEFASEAINFYTNTQH